MNKDIAAYSQRLDPADNEICEFLSLIINDVLVEAESKIWHAHPVWFLNGNPIVGFSKEKKGLRLMFWSGADFEEEDLKFHGQKFKDASIFYKTSAEIDKTKLSRWLEKAKNIQWDYKNIVKRKGQLERLK